MQNINELIGIIRGINFDGVINDKEIVYLQSWVDKNRNLACEPYEAKLIKMIDSVLEDQIIDDKEKEMILECADQFLKKMGDDPSKVYELNGIIEGIICDGELNEAEVYRLKEWMDTYGDELRNHRSSIELCKVIDNILGNGIVSEEEREVLLEMLSDRISDSQFETKFEYLCKQVKARKNIGIDLIDILDNEIAIREIHKRAETQLMRALASYSTYIAKPEIIIVSLVLIAMIEYDGNYYGSVRSAYLAVYKKYSEQKVEGLIRTILGRYKKQNDSGSRSRIINVALENAIVPQAFLSAFFEFIFDIYKLNFEYDLPEELYEDFKFVFEGLRSNMLSDGDDISVNVTQKTYKLIVATKQLITKEDGLDAIIKLSILIVKLIDKHFWYKEVKIFNPYLRVGYEGWKSKLKDVARSGHDYKHSSLEFHSRWEPKFMMINNKDICLIPPTHRLKAQYDYQSIVVLVLNNKEVLYRNNDCDVREIIGGYQINTGKIVIDKPLGKLTYRLIAGDEIIYDSKEKLYREYIVFNEEGQEINNNTDYEGPAYFCYRTDEVELQSILTNERFSIGYKLIRIGDAIGIGHDVFNFSSMIKPGIFGQLHRNCFVKIDGEDKWLPVYKKVNVVTFETDNIAPKYEITVNGKSKKLSEMQYKVTIRGAISKYVVEIGFEKSGIYTIEVNQFVSGKKNRILREVFAYDAELKFSANKMSDDVHRVTVNSGLLTGKIDTDVNAKDFNIYFLKFEIDGIAYNYLLPFDFGFYKISGREWQSSSSEIWIDDVQADSTLSVYDSECDSLLVYAEDGSLVEDDIVFKDENFYKQLSIGFLNSYKNDNRYVLLVFMADGQKKYTITCYNKCVIKEEETEILFLDNPKQLLVTPVFHGKNKVFFELFDFAGEKIYKSRDLCSGQTEKWDGFNSFEEYTINFHQKTKVLMLRKNTLLFKINKTFYARHDFVGHTFKIDVVYFNQDIKGEFLEKSYCFNKVYLRINKMLEHEIFQGEVLVKTFQGERYLNEINPVKIEICSEVVDDTMDIYITNEKYGDGLLVDFDKHGILNSLEHPTAPDIFLYTINMKGEIQCCKN